VHPAHLKKLDSRLSRLLAQRVESNQLETADGEPARVSVRITCATGEWQKVESSVAELGGSVTGKADSSHALGAVVPIRGILELIKDKVVRQVELTKKAFGR
jgi:hypothetical protein